jgi:hypothetical protein
VLRMSQVTSEFGRDSVVLLLIILLRMKKTKQDLLVGEVVLTGQLKLLPRVTVKAGVGTKTLDCQSSDLGAFSLVAVSVSTNTFL